MREQIVEQQNANISDAHCIMEPPAEQALERREDANSQNLNKRPTTPQKDATKEHRDIDC